MDSSAHQFRCMCCKDSGILPDYIVRKYVAHHAGHGLDNSAEPPFLCQACDNIYAQVQTNRGLQFLPKMPLEWTNRSLTVNDCRIIHVAETDAMKATKAQTEAVDLQVSIDSLANQKAMKPTKGKSPKRTTTATEPEPQVETIDHSSIDELGLMEELGLLV
jgi:hypothetical protein